MLLNAVIYLVFRYKLEIIEVDERNLACRMYKGKFRFFDYSRGNFFKVKGTDCPAVVELFLYLAFYGIGDPFAVFFLIV